MAQPAQKITIIAMQIPLGVTQGETSITPSYIDHVKGTLGNGIVTIWEGTVMSGTPLYTNAPTNSITDLNLNLIQAKES